MIKKNNNKYYTVLNELGYGTNYNMTFCGRYNKDITWSVDEIPERRFICIIYSC